MDGFNMDGDDGFGLEGEPVDLTGDGNADALASAADLDGDGMADSLLYQVPTDTDQNGMVDGVQTLIDVGGDGTIDAIALDQAVDTDSDGNFDSVVHAVDYDADGTYDDGTVEQVGFAAPAQGSADGTAAAPATEPVAAPADLDGDGTAESVVVEVAEDTDHDGVVDKLTTVVDAGADGTVDAVVEQRALDTNSDGAVDAVVTVVDSNADGTADQVVVEEAVDTDHDGTADTVNTYVDSDADGEIDGVIDGGGPQPATDAYPDHGNFDPTTATDVAGEPADDMQYWHQQTYPDTCAVVSQEYILESLTGQDFDEDELRQEAIDNGWYTPGAGTPLGQMGAILEAHGIEVERSSGASIDDIEAKLESGDKVLVAIDADETWEAGRSASDDSSVGDANGIPGQDANHAVEVIGIDRSDPNNPMVILNDPGHPDGKGMLVPLDEFQDAWEDSGNYMVATA